MEITFLSIDTGHDLYPGWFSLRQELLRDPLGVSFSAAEYRSEKEDRHLIGLLGDRLVGGLLIRTVGMPEMTWKIRQVAVESNFQSQGIGRRLMQEVILEARNAGIEQLILHSRETVCGFYDSLGFERLGERFEEVGIPHQKMVLSLAST